MENKITFQGSPLNLVGNSTDVGKELPEVELVANDMSKVKLSSYKGKLLVICTVPSLDTPVCDIEIKKFNQEATNLSDAVQVLAISADLPFAQARWCGAANIKRVKTLSDYNGLNLANGMGVLIDELKLLARAVFIVDREGVVRYVQLVKELTNEPDYEDVLKALKDLI
ncbi:MAG: thiol peroxidase [Pseudomonadota bacterium]